jgi:hypothetical protein
MLCEDFLNAYRADLKLMFDKDDLFYPADPPNQRSKKRRIQTPDVW